MPALASSVVAPGRRAASLLALAAMLLPAAASAQPQVDLLGRDVMSLPELSSDGAAPAGWTLERSQTLAMAPAWRPPATAAAAPTWQPSATVMQTMLWARRERLGLGLGVEQRGVAVAPTGAGAATPAAREAGLLVGVSWATGESSQLTWAAPLVSSRQPDGLAWTGLDRAPEREMRLGLEFRKRDPYADLRRGALMKFELSRDTTVSLKPRHGRVGFTLTSRW